MPLLSDPIGDLLTRIRNAQAAGRASCKAPWSKIKLQLCELLVREGWLAETRVIGEAPKQEIEVLFATDRPRLTLSRVSKPGRRLYASSKDIRPVLRGFGIAVLTTSEGLLTDRQARERNIGGEVLCTIA